MKAKLPSVGFLAVCGTYALVVAFFGWALSTPALDRVWWIDHALKTGKMRRLKPDDRTLLAGSLARHPGLGRALLGGRAIGILSENTDGWIATPTVVVLRTPESHQITRLRLEVQTPADLLPCTLRIRGPGWKRTLELEQQGVETVELPPPGQVAGIIELRLRGRVFRADPSMLGLRVGFGGRP